MVYNKYTNEFGQLHRLDGPAIELANGDKEWWISGQFHREDGPAIECVNGDKFWYINGKLHREDGPAIECANGDNEWWINGNRHRIDGPAIEYVHGTKAWFINGKRHRIDGPAIEWGTYSKFWYIDGKEYTKKQFDERNNNMNVNNLVQIDSYGTKRYYNKDGQHHRENGPAVEWADGSRHWHINNKFHRIDGPAIEHANGDKSWLVNGELHRIGGPAIECVDGDKEWYINGKRHRIDGPAIERVNCGINKWFIEGKEYNEKEFDEKNNIIADNIMKTHYKDIVYNVLSSFINSDNKIDDDVITIRLSVTTWWDIIIKGPFGLLEYVLSYDEPDSVILRKISSNNSFYQVKIIKYKLSVGIQAYFVDNRAERQTPIVLFNIYSKEYFKALSILKALKNKQVDNQNKLEHKNKTELLNMYNEILKAGDNKGKLSLVDTEHNNS